MRWQRASRPKARYFWTKKNFGAFFSAIDVKLITYSFFSDSAWKIEHAFHMTKHLLYKESAAVVSSETRERVHFCLWKRVSATQDPSSASLGKDSRPDSESTAMFRLSPSFQERSTTRRFP